MKSNGLDIINIEGVKTLTGFAYYGVLYGTVNKGIFNPYLQHEAKVRQKRSKKAYRYRFNHPIPGDDKKTWHSGDLWYFFGSVLLLDILVNLISK